MRKILVVALLILASLHAWSFDAGVELEKAVKKGDVRSVQKIIETCIDPDLIDESSLRENTPLMNAAKYGHYELAKMLIEKGADPNLQNAEFKTPLLFAVDRNYLEVVRLLIKNGANIELAGDDNRTPLYWAVVKNRKEIVRILLAAGANPKAEWDNYLEDKKLTILQTALKQKGIDSDIIAMLKGEKPVKDAQQFASQAPAETPKQFLPR